ncbi:hypothetical protein [Streptomyces albospinus]|uniref:hypothetical protein n=1 Tax=Streptomyces albospinus TaxID=285515 RepID=UPI0016710C3D|nr:hypothetical protein [Streptomyces albospinus]
MTGARSSAHRPEKSLRVDRITEIPPNPQVKDMIGKVVGICFKYGETARGGLAVDIGEC